MNPNEEYYFKSQDQMKELFLDIPQAIDNISEIVDKIELFHTTIDSSIIIDMICDDLTGINDDDCIDQAEGDFCNDLKCKIPYLNGGLFQEIENYSWKDYFLNIPNNF